MAGLLWGVGIEPRRSRGSDPRIRYGGQQGRSTHSDLRITEHRYLLAPRTERRLIQLIKGESEARLHLLSISSSLDIDTA